MTPDDFQLSVQRALRLLKALANENRLILLCALVEGEKNVGELEKATGVRQPTLSQQLTYLRGAELVSTRRASKQIYYSLAKDEVREIIAHLHDLYCPEAADRQAAQAQPAKPSAAILAS